MKLDITMVILYLVTIFELQLDCRAEGNDAISYRWTRDGNSIAEFKNTGILKIDKVTKDDKGTYECLARNGAGTVSAPTKATLVVKGIPVQYNMII